MFSVTWTPINKKVLTDNLGLGQCHVDIVGDSTTYYPLFIGLDDVYVYFRMRVNCDPRQNKNKPELQNSIWGILIKTTAGTPIYTVRVNAKNDPDSNAVQVFKADATNPFIPEPDGDPLCSNTIVYGDAGNVQSNAADSSLYGTQDYFIDFRTPLDCFPDGFFEGELIYCGFTSETKELINKEIPPPYSTDTPNLCGGSVEPPPVNIILSKDVQPRSVRCQNDVQEFSVTITVTNDSDEELTGVTLSDNINAAFVITVAPNPENIWTPVTFDPNETIIFNYTVSGYFPNSGTLPFNTAIVTQDSTELGRITGPEITVGDCGRGLYVSI